MNFDTGKELLKFSLSETMFGLQFGKQFNIFWLADIYYLTIFYKICCFRLSCIGIRIGNEEEKTEDEKNDKIGKGE